MTRKLASIAVTLALAAAAPGCVIRSQFATPSLDEDLEQLQRDIDVLPPFPEPATETGSLWTSAGPGAALVRDTRAFRINDLVTVVLLESTAGANESNTDLTRSANIGFSAPFAFGLEKNQILDTTTDSEFSGDGRTTRRSSLTGTITTRVARVLPNGDLVVAGQKTVMVNREKQVLTMVGAVRPVDINASNRVGSSEVGELTVRMWGSGEVDDTVRQGWFMRVMNRLWPF